MPSIQALRAAIMICNGNVHFAENENGVVVDCDLGYRVSINLRSLFSLILFDFLVNAVSICEENKNSIPPL